MPEYAELHNSAHQVERWAAGRTFVRASTRAIPPADDDALNGALSHAFPAAATRFGAAPLRELAPAAAATPAGRRVLAALAEVC